MIHAIGNGVRCTLANGLLLSDGRAPRLGTIGSYRLARTGAESRGGPVNVHSAELESGLLEWARWPEREDLSIELLRVLGAAQEAGATFAECHAAAKRIDRSDDLSWYREWRSVADANCARGNRALRAGHVLTAKSNWLRAMNYYQAAAFPFDRADSHHQGAVAMMRQCARDYLAHCSPQGRVLSIPWPGGRYELEAYFLPAAQVSGPSPAIICMGEPGSHKEEYLYKLARYAREREISLLAVDLLGGKSDSRFDEVVGRSDLEKTVGHIMDHLLEQDDVDARRIAILADCWGSSFVARGIAFDDRFAAAVCDGGIWDLQERAFLAGRAARRGERMQADRGLVRAVRGIKCPILITAGEAGWLEAARVRELCEEIRAAGADVTLKMFSASETGSMQAHMDNPTLANEYIFDWIGSCLRGRAN